MDPLSSALAWIKIGQVILAGGITVVDDFKKFLADHGIEADNANLDAQLADIKKRKAEEQAIRDGDT